MEGGKIGAKYVAQASPGIVLLLPQPPQVLRVQTFASTWGLKSETFLSVYLMSQVGNPDLTSYDRSENIRAYNNIVNKKIKITTWLCV